MESKLLVKVVLVSATSVVLTLLVIVGVAWAGNIFTVDRDGTVRLTISDIGNVGIGTETPQSRLEVKGSGTTSATSALNVTASDGTSRMYVRDDGNIGIGTASPNEKLKVAGNISISDKIVFAGSSTQAVAYRASIPAGTTYYVPDNAIPRGAVVVFSEDSGYSGGIFTFYRHGSYNLTRAVSHAPSTTYGFGVTSDPGTGDVRFWVENNNAGGRLVIRNTRTWTAEVILYVFLAG